jgi:hypothetical protein
VPSGRAPEPLSGATRGNGLSQAIYYAADIEAASPGPNQLTVTFDQPAVFVDLRATEYSGLRQSGPFQAGASNSGTGSGFTSRVITSPDGDIVEDAVAVSAGSHTATAPLSSGTWLLQLAAFRGP